MGFVSLRIQDLGALEVRESSQPGLEPARGQNTSVWNSLILG